MPGSDNALPLQDLEVLLQILPHFFIFFRIGATI
jgi:hypothetical protein